MSLQLHVKVNVMSHSIPATRKSARAKLRKSVVFAMLLSLGGAEHEALIDAVAAATQVAPPPATPNINIDPPPVNNVFRVAEGEKITFTVNATDPNGFFSVALLNTILPAGATFTPTLYDCCYGNARSRVFSWTPGVGTATTQPVTTLKLTALNWHTPGQRPPYPTRNWTISIVVDDNQAPSFDASIPRRQSAVVGETLVFPLTVMPDPDDDAVVISAQGLPPGAVLSKAQKDAASGRWSAVMRWKPTKFQLNKTYNATFIAQDDNLVSSAQSTYPVTFSVAAPITRHSPIKAVRVSRSQWNEQTSLLMVSGSVHRDENEAAQEGLEIVLTNPATHAEIATVPVADDGSWQYAGQLPNAEAPCVIQATESSSGRMASYTVKKAPLTCL